jgi:hypothetical protein
VPPGRFLPALVLRGCLLAVPTGPSEALTGACRGSGVASSSGTLRAGPCPRCVQRRTSAGGRAAVIPGRGPTLGAPVPLLPGDLESSFLSGCVHADSPVNTAPRSSTPRHLLGRTGAMHDSRGRRTNATNGKRASPAPGVPHPHPAPRRRLRRILAALAPRVDRHPYDRHHYLTGAGAFH